MTGTGIAQAIPVAMSPLLTRLYSPEDFGNFAIYTGILNVLLVFTTGKYELSILLPEKEEDAFNLVKLTSLFALVFSLIIFLIIFLFNSEICDFLGNQEISSWLYFMPYSIFIAGNYKALNYWLNRNKDFKKLAANRVLQTASTGGSQLAFGASNFNSIFLLIGSLIGQTVSLLNLTRNILTEKRDILSLNKERIKYLLKKYSDFPKYEIPSNLLNVGSTHAPNILFPILFSTNYSGFYYLTQRVLQAPINLISTSVLDVFKEEASRSFRKNNEARLIYRKTFKWLIAVSFIPSITLFFFVDDLFTFFFGEEWAIAGKYAQILVPSLALKFIANPLSFMIYIAEKQKWNLIIMIFLVFGIILSFLIAENHLGVVKGISTTLVFYYIIHLYISARLSKAFRIE